MAEHDLRQRVEVSDDDQTVATAEVITSEGSGGTARVSLRAEPGHIAPGRRACLVDAVLDLPQVRGSARLEAAFRLGDGESLRRLQERCEDATAARPGGARSSMRTFRPAAPGSPSRTRPARNPCRAIAIACSPLRPPEGVLTDGVVSLRVPPSSTPLPATSASAPSSYASKHRPTRRGPAEQEVEQEDRQRHRHVQPRPKRLARQWSSDEPSEPRYYVHDDAVLFIRPLAWIGLRATGAAARRRPRRDGTRPGSTARPRQSAPYLQAAAQC